MVKWMMNWKGLEGNIHCQSKILSWHLLGELRKTWEISARISGGMDEIWTRHCNDTLLDNVSNSILVYVAPKQWNSNLISSDQAFPSVQFKWSQISPINYLHFSGFSVHIHCYQKKPSLGVSLYICTVYLTIFQAYSLKDKAKTECMGTWSVFSALCDIS